MSDRIPGRSKSSTASSPFCTACAVKMVIIESETMVSPEAIERRRSFECRFCGEVATVNDCLSSAA